MPLYPSPTIYDFAYNTIVIESEHKSKFKFKENSPYFAVTGKVWGAYCEDFGKDHPDSKVYGTNMGPIWGPQDPGGPHVGPMNLTIWVAIYCVWLQWPIWCDIYKLVQKSDPLACNIYVYIK